MYPEDVVATWLQGSRVAEACTVPDTNHYSILLGAPGAAAVARAIAEAYGTAGTTG